jgi:hypothetical protein
LGNLLYHEKTRVRTESCWAISNIAAGTSECIQECIDLGIVEKMLYLLVNNTEEIKKEVIRGLYNCTKNATPS